MFEIKQGNVIIDDNLNELIFKLFEKFNNGDYDYIKGTSLKILIGYHRGTNSNIYLKYINKPYNKSSGENVFDFNDYIEIYLINPIDNHGESLKILISEDHDDPEDYLIKIVGNINLKHYAYQEYNINADKTYEFRLFSRVINEYDLNIFLNDIVDFYTIYSEGEVEAYNLFDELSGVLRDY